MVESEIFIPIDFLELDLYWFGVIPYTFLNNVKKWLRLTKPKFSIIVVTESSEEANKYLAFSSLTILMKSAIDTNLYCLNSLLK